MGYNAIKQERKGDQHEQKNAIDLSGNTSYRVASTGICSSASAPATVRSGSRGRDHSSPDSQGRNGSGSGGPRNGDLDEPKKERRKKRRVRERSSFTRFLARSAWHVYIREPARTTCSYGWLLKNLLGFDHRQSA